MFSPDQSFIVSVGTEGAIFIWHVPQEIQDARADNEMPEREEEPENEIELPPNDM